MDTNKDKNEFLNNFCKNSDSEENEEVSWNKQDNFLENQSNLLKNKQTNSLDPNPNSKVTTSLNQDDIIPAFKKMNIRETSANKNKPISKDLALNYYFGFGERQSNQNGNNEDPFELSSTNNNKQQDATTYIQFNHNNFFQQNVSQQQQSPLPINTTTNSTSQPIEQELLNEQHQQQSNFTKLFNVNIDQTNNSSSNNNNQQSSINASNSNSIIEKYNVNSQPYIPKNKDLNFYKNPQLLSQQGTAHPQLQPQHQLLPNTNVDDQLYKLNLSKSSSIPGKFYVIKSVDEANIIRVRSFQNVLILFKPSLSFDNAKASDKNSNIS